MQLIDHNATRVSFKNVNGIMPLIISKHKHIYTHSKLVILHLLIWDLHKSSLKLITSPVLFNNTSQIKPLSTLKIYSANYYKFQNFSSSPLPYGFSFFLIYSFCNTQYCMGIFFLTLKITASTLPPRELSLMYETCSFHSINQEFDPVYILTTKYSAWNRQFL